MTKTIFGKVARAGKVTVLAAGLAVVLALVFGASTAALAAVPGDPFKLGRVNTIDRVSKLVGGVSGALFKVDNNGGVPPCSWSPSQARHRLRSTQRPARQPTSTPMR